MVNRLKRCFRCGIYQHLHGDKQWYCYRCHSLIEAEKSREDK